LSANSERGFQGFLGFQRVFASLAYSLSTWNEFQLVTYPVELLLRSVFPLLYNRKCNEERCKRVGFPSFLTDCMVLLVGIWVIGFRGV
jgi:hypothetical protein